MAKYQSVAHMFRARVESTPDREAFTFRKGGAWTAVNWKQVRDEAAGMGVMVTGVDIGYYICWGAERWLHRFDPDRARREGVAPQVAAALEKMRAKLTLDPEPLS